jgi:DNA polymerase-3 subunit epsilon
MDFVALDVETANNCSGSICSIGLARFNGNALQEEYYSLIRPPEELGEFNHHCVQVHGIMASDVFASPSFADALTSIERFIGDSLLVAHNAPFDSRHFHSAMNMAGIRRNYQFVCTLALARRMLTLPNYRLESVCQYFDINLGHHHNALNDAIACGRVFSKLSEL